MKIREEGVISEPSIVELGKAARLRQEQTLALLRQLVEVESPSSDKAAVDRCMQVAATACRETGGKVRWHRQKEYGDMLEAHFPANGGATKSPKRPLLLLGHLDTVWPVGTLAKMPFMTKSGRVFGPGVFDMKAGVAMALSALSILKERRRIDPSGDSASEQRRRDRKPGVASHHRGDCQRMRSGLCAGAGPGADGAYKTSRKGTGDYIVRVTGVAAHAGVDFRSGHSAVLELARQIQKIGRLPIAKRG